jgi:hypothetical protein
VNDSRDLFGDSPDERDFDDPALDEVRRLLAGARATEGVPEDVAARLDATLASLREERSAEDGPAAPVVPLRRRFARVLVAAAAVVVVGSGGVGIAQLADHGSGSDSRSSADRAVTADRDSAGAGVAPTAPGTAPEKTPLYSALADAALPSLTTARFGQQVSRLMRTTYAADARTSAPPTTSQDRSKGLAGELAASQAPSAPPVTRSPAPATADGAEPAVSCPGPVVPGAITVPAVLDGAPVALVFRPSTPEEQVVEAWSCDGATLLVSATVPH